MVTKKISFKKKVIKVGTSAGVLIGMPALKIIDAEFGDVVRITIENDENEVDRMIKKISKKTGAKKVQILIDKGDCDCENGKEKD